MHTNTMHIALGGMMAALSIVILLFGSMLGIGIYAAPMIAGLCLLPARRKLGAKWHALLWLAVSLLSFILISDMEQNLMYLCLFGFYPILRPHFQKLNGPLKPILKLLYFNTVTIAVETAVLLFFAPEVLGAVMIATLFILGNITFLCYDYMIPVFEILMEKYLKKFFKN